MSEDTPDRSGERERVASLPDQAMVGLDLRQILEVKEGDVGRIRSKPGLLRNDDNHPAPEAEVGEVVAEQGRGLGGGHVLEDMGEEEAVVALRGGIGAGGELVAGVGGQTAAPGDLDRMWVGVDTYTFTIEVLEIPSYPASDVEHAAFDDSSNVPSIRHLNTEQPLPSLAGLFLKAGGVVAIGAHGFETVGTFLPLNGEVPPEAGRGTCRGYPPEPVPTHPSVTVILPVLDEADHIDDVMADLMAQDYQGPVEVIVADGGSTDGTLQKLAAVAEQGGRVRVIENPDARQAFGLNRAAAEAKGDILVRADGHTRFAPDYVRRSVEVLSETGGAVGGRMSPMGKTPFGRAVMAAMRSPLTMGPGRFHHATEREEVDTVYLGAFSREEFEELGGFRPFPSGSSEDADFYYRWRSSDRKVFVDPSIVSTYTPRDTPRSLWRQYFRYGQGKAEMLWLNGELPSLRPMAPLLLVLGAVAGVALGILSGAWWPLLAGLGVWLLLLLGVAVTSGESIPRVLSAAGIMHLAYGLGMVWGLTRGPGAVRRS